MRTNNFEKIFQDIFKNIPEAVAVYEAIDGGKDFIIKFFNRSAEKIEKVKASKIIDKKITDIFPSVKKFGILKILSRVWKTGKPERFPLGFYKDKRIAGWRDNFIFKLPSGELVAIYTDETKVKQFEESLRESEESSRQNKEKLSITLKSIGDAVIATDITGRITLLNFEAQKLTKWTEKGAVGQPLEKVFDIFNEKTGKKVVSPVFKVMRSGMIVGLGNHTVLIGKNGQKMCIEDSAAPIKDNQGKVIGVVLVFRDVTKKRETEQKLFITANTLKVITKCNEALIHIPDEEELLNAICNSQIFADRDVRFAGQHPQEDLLGMDRKRIFNDEWFCIAHSLTTAHGMLRNEARPTCIEKLILPVPAERTAIH